MDDRTEREAAEAELLGHLKEMEQQGERASLLAHGWLWKLNSNGTASDTAAWRKRLCICQGTQSCGGQGGDERGGEKTDTGVGAHHQGGFVGKCSPACLSYISEKKAGQLVKVCHLINLCGIELASFPDAGRRYAFVLSFLIILLSPSLLNPRVSLWLLRPFCCLS